jgi:nucleotide-binding universal stress UspA family protein
VRSRLREIHLSVAKMDDEDYLNLKINESLSMNIKQGKQRDIELLTDILLILFRRRTQDISIYDLLPILQTKYNNLSKDTLSNNLEYLSRMFDNEPFVKITHEVTGKKGKTRNIYKLNIFYINEFSKIGDTDRAQMPIISRRLFEKVLIPTDFSKHARKVIKCVGDIPGVKEIVLLNVITRSVITRVWDPTAELDEVGRKLTEEKKIIAAPEIDVKIRAISVLEGEVAKVIHKVAEEEKVSLVAMGARGQSRIESVFLGSVFRGVLRFGDTHLLVMLYKVLENGNLEKHCARILAKVLFPTDFSQPAEMALSFFKNIQGVGEMILLNVVSTDETDEKIDANVAAATQKVNEIARELSKGGLKVTTKVIVGHPVEEIRSLAEKEDVSLIAICSQGATAIKKSRIRSTAYDVANSATRPVLILRRSKVVIY